MAIEHAQEPGSKLIIATDRLHPQGFSVTQIDPIAPANVALWIEQALEMGWIPRTSGKPFHVAVVKGSLTRSEV